MLAWVGLLELTARMIDSECVVVVVVVVVVADDGKGSG